MQGFWEPDLPPTCPGRTKTRVCWVLRGWPWSSLMNFPFSVATEAAGLGFDCELALDRIWVIFLSLPAPPPLPTKC